MKVISLLQPWASLVVTGVKKIETRSWNTNHRGTILIHAGKGKAGEIFASEKPFSTYTPDFNKLPFGAVIGAVTITNCFRIDSLNMNDIGINALTLEQKRLETIPQGLRGCWKTVSNLKNAMAQKVRCIFGIVLRKLKKKFYPKSI